MSARLSLLVPFPALVVGILIMASHSVPAGVWAQNLVTAAVCVLLVEVVLITRRPKSDNVAAEEFCGGKALLWVCLLAAPVAMALTFANEGLRGVHRWVFVGPVRLHAASIVLPPFLVGLGLAEARQAKVGWSFAILTGALLALQPDASEAAALLSALAALLILSGGKCRRAGWIGAVFAALGVVACWRIRDGLWLVPHVEGIIHLAARIHPALAAIGIVALAAVPVQFFYHASQSQAREEPGRGAALAVAVYFSTYIIISAGTGWYPVIFLGYGASPILGYYLAYGALQRGEAMSERVNQ